MKVAWIAKKKEKFEVKRKFTKTSKNEFAEEEISIAFVARRKCLLHCAVKIPKFIDIRERPGLIEFSIFTRREEKLFCEMWKRGKKFHRFPTADGVIFSFPNGGKQEEGRRIHVL